MIEFLVGAACYVTFYALLPGVGSLMQASGLVFLFCAAMYAVMFNRVKAMPVSATELIMHVLGVLYVATALFHDVDTLMSSVAFLCTVILISIVTRALPLARFLDIGAWVALTCVLTAIAVDHREAVATLSISIGRRGLERFSPLETTADLTGYLFGAGAILMARRAIVSTKLLQRLLFAAGTVVACLFVLAASARASLIALALAAMMAVGFELGFKRILALTWVRIVGVMFVLCGAVFSGKILSYLGQILEVDSSTRGVASGGTGRTELWARGMASLFGNATTFVLGGGFRSSNANLIGFSTESSYITILLDSGIFLGAAVILVFWYAPIKALKLTEPGSRHSSSLVLLATFMAFLVIQSVFNRYLLAIGNPISLMSLLILFSLALQPGLARPARSVASTSKSVLLLGKEMRDAAVNVRRQRIDVGLAKHADMGTDDPDDL